MNFLYTLDITIVSQVFTSTLRCSSSGFVLSSWAVSTSSSILSPPSPPSLLPKSTQARVASCPLPFAQPTPQHRPPLTQSRRWPRGPAPRQTASGTHRVETPTPHTRKPRAGIRDTRAITSLPSLTDKDSACGWPRALVPFRAPCTPNQILITSQTHHKTNQPTSHTRTTATTASGPGLAC